MRVVVVGGGSWGSVFAALLAERGHEVDARLPRRRAGARDRRDGTQPALRPGADLRGVRPRPLEEAPVAEAELVCLAVPSRAFGEVVAAPARRTRPVLSLAKGLDPTTGGRLSTRRRGTAGGGALGPEPRRGDRAGPAGRRGDRLRGRGARRPAPGGDHLAALPRLREHRPRRGRALRRGEERHRARGRGRGRARVRRQRQGGAHHARPGGDGAARRGVRARGRRRSPGLPAWATSSSRAGAATAATGGPAS